MNSVVASQVIRPRFLSQRSSISIESCLVGPTIIQALHVYMLFCDLRTSTLEQMFDWATHMGSLYMPTIPSVWTSQSLADNISEESYAELSQVKQNQPGLESAARHLADWGRSSVGASFRQERRK